MSPVVSGPASVETRRRQGHRVLLASMVVSVAVHAFALSRGINPPDAPSERLATALRSPDTRSGIQISGILVPAPAGPLAWPTPATAEIVAEPNEREPEDPPPTSDPEPENPSATSNLSVRKPRAREPLLRSGPVAAIPCSGETSETFHLVRG